MNKVYIVGRSFFGDFVQMFTKRGWTIVDNIKDADVVQFTGGADISPKFYGQNEHQYTGTSPSRDKEEYEAFVEAKKQGKFLAGVCRGGQLLNALSGGNIYQHVDNHGLGLGGHGMVDVQTGNVIPVSSLHHQMMIMGDNAILMGRSETVRSKTKLMMTPIHEEPGEVVDEDDSLEVEACFYPTTKAFCYQPHPEFMSDSHPCREWYFNKLHSLLEEYS